MGSFAAPIIGAGIGLIGNALGGNKKTTTQDQSGSSNSTLTPNVPDWMLGGMGNAFSGIGNYNFPFYQGSPVAPQAPGELFAQQAVAGIPGIGDPLLNSASQQAMQAVQSGGYPTDPQLQSLINPYQQNVIDVAKEGIWEDRDRMYQELGGQAAMSGAFGGARHGVQKGEIDRATLRGLAETQYGGMKEAYDTGYDNWFRGLGSNINNINTAVGLGETMQERAYRHADVMNQLGMQQRDWAQGYPAFDVSQWQMGYQHPFMQAQTMFGMPYAMYGMNEQSQSTGSGSRTDPGASMMDSILGGIGLGMNFNSAFPKFGFGGNKDGGHIKGYADGQRVRSATLIDKFTGKDDDDEDDPLRSYESWLENEGFSGNKNPFQKFADAGSVQVGGTPQPTGTKPAGGGSWSGRGPTSFLGRMGGPLYSGVSRGMPARYWTGSRQMQGLAGAAGLVNPFLGLAANIPAMSTMFDGRPGMQGGGIFGAIANWLDPGARQKRRLGRDKLAYYGGTGEAPQVSDWYRNEFGQNWDKGTIGVQSGVNWKNADMSLYDPTKANSLPTQPSKGSWWSSGMPQGNGGGKSYGTKGDFGGGGGGKGGRGGRGGKLEKIYVKKKGKKADGGSIRGYSDGGYPSGYHPEDGWIQGTSNAPGTGDWRSRIFGHDNGPDDGRIYYKINEDGSVTFDPASDEWYQAYTGNDTDKLSRLLSGMPMAARHNMRDKAPIEFKLAQLGLLGGLQTASEPVEPPVTDPTETPAGPSIPSDYLWQTLFGDGFNIDPGDGSDPTNLSYGDALLGYPDPYGSMLGGYALSPAGYSPTNMYTYDPNSPTGMGLTQRGPSVMTQDYQPGVDAPYYAHQANPFGAMSSLGSGPISPFTQGGTGSSNNRGGAAAYSSFLERLMSGNPFGSRFQSHPAYKDGGKIQKFAKGGHVKQGPILLEEGGFTVESRRDPSASLSLEDLRRLEELGLNITPRNPADAEGGTHPWISSEDLTRGPEERNQASRILRMLGGQEPDGFANGGLAINQIDDNFNPFAMMQSPFMPSTVAGSSWKDQVPTGVPGTIQKTQSPGMQPNNGPVMQPNNNFGWQGQSNPFSGMGQGQGQGSPFAFANGGYVKGYADGELARGQYQDNGRSFLRDLESLGSFAGRYINPAGPTIAALEAAGPHIAEGAQRMNANVQANAQGAYAPYPGLRQDLGEPGLMANIGGVPHNDRGGIDLMARYGDMATGATNSPDAIYPERRPSSGPANAETLSEAAAQITEESGKDAKQGEPRENILDSLSYRLADWWNSPTAQANMALMTQGRDSATPYFGLAEEEQAQKQQNKARQASAMHEAQMAAQEAQTRREHDFALADQRHQNRIEQIQLGAQLRAANADPAYADAIGEIIDYAQDVLGDDYGPTLTDDQQNAFALELRQHVAPLPPPEAAVVLNILQNMVSQSMPSGGRGGQNAIIFQRLLSEMGIVDHTAQESVSGQLTGGN